MANVQNQSGGCVAQIGLILILSITYATLSTCFNGSKKPVVPAVAPPSTVGETDEEIRALGRQWAAEDAAWQPPKGFELSKEMQDARGRPVKAAVRWLSPGQYSCDIGNRCWGLEVIPIQYCSRIYAEITLLNASDTNVGMTNDFSSEVNAKSKVRFVFGSYESGAKTARLAKLTCL